MDTDCLAIEFILDIREKGNVNIPALLQAVRICPSKVMLNEEGRESVVLFWSYTASKDRSAWDVPNTVLRYVFDFRLEEIMKQPFACWCYYTGDAASVFQFGAPFLLYCNATKQKSLAKFGDKAYLFNPDEYVSENDVLVFLLNKNYALVRDLYKRLCRSSNGAAYTGIITSLYREICAQETALLHRGILEKYADIKIRSMLLKLREKFWENGSDETHHAFSASSI